MPGKVYFIGAGPGDPGLLTLKGRSVLERADCVIYDFSAAEELLRFCPPNAERIFVGEPAGGLRCPQEEIEQLLIAKAQEVGIVARLKGGDPFVFGRGDQEALALVRAGIPFEIVPGVTAGLAAPAYAGIPLTYRDFASSACFLAGREDLAKEESTIDWGAVAASRSTLVFFTGTRNLAALASKLAAHGRSAETPVAVIRWGTLPRQQVVTGTLRDIAQRAADLQPPTVIVVGEVVRLREQLNWFERLPLFGKRIVITRAREQAGTLRQALAELGAEVIEVPTIEIRDPASWERLDGAIRRLEEFQYLLLTSANGVRNFLARLRACGRDVRDLKGLTIGAIGPATAAEFAKTGVQVDFVPGEYRAEGLLEALAGRDLRGKSFLIPRAKVARDLVPRVLSEHGAHVEVVEAYETVTPEYRAEELDRLMSPPPDVITFTSSSTASNFARLFGHRPLKDVLRAAVVASIGPVTSETVRKLGLEVTVEAKESTIPGLVEALRQYFQS
jgi:uroporphyrinogen III methyltransferase/synthase